MPHGAVPFPFGDCRICTDRATGVHYGVATCEGCKGFFKRSIPKAEKYKCFFGGQCVLTPQNRNRCKACRFKRCLANGMSTEAVKMGRIPKVDKERALEVHRQQEDPDVDGGHDSEVVTQATSQHQRYPGGDAAPGRSLNTSTGGEGRGSSASSSFAAVAGGVDLVRGMAPSTAPYTNTAAGPPFFLPSGDSSSARDGFHLGLGEINERTLNSSDYIDSDSENDPDEDDVVGDYGHKERGSDCGRGAMMGEGVWDSLADSGIGTEGTASEDPSSGASISPRSCPRSPFSPGVIKELISQVIESGNGPELQKTLLTQFFDSSGGGGGGGGADSGDSSSVAAGKGGADMAGAGDRGRDAEVEGRSAAIPMNGAGAGGGAREISAGGRFRLDGDDGGSMQAGATLQPAKFRGQTSLLQQPTSTHDASHWASKAIKRRSTGEYRQGNGARPPAPPANMQPPNQLPYPYSQDAAAVDHPFNDEPRPNQHPIMDRHIDNLARFVAESVIDSSKLPAARDYGPSMVMGVAGRDAAMVKNEGVVGPSAEDHSSQYRPAGHSMKTEQFSQDAGIYPADYRLDRDAGTVQYGAAQQPGSISQAASHMNLSPPQNEDPSLSATHNAPVTAYGRSHCPSYPGQSPIIADQPQGGYSAVTLPNCPMPPSGSASNCSQPPGGGLPNCPQPPSGSGPNYQPPPGGGLRNCLPPPSGSIQNYPQPPGGVLPNFQQQALVLSATQGVPFSASNPSLPPWLSSCSPQQNQFVPSTSWTVSGSVLATAPGSVPGCIPAFVPVPAPAPAVTALAVTAPANVSLGKPWLLDTELDLTLHPESGIRPEQNTTLQKPAPCPTAYTQESKAKAKPVKSGSKKPRRPPKTATAAPEARLGNNPAVVPMDSSSAAGTTTWYASGGPTTSQSTGGSAGFKDASDFEGTLKQLESAAMPWMQRLEHQERQMEDERGGHTQPHVLNRLKQASRSHVQYVWDQLMASIPENNTVILGMCQAVPSFDELDPKDQAILMEEAYFDVWLIRNSVLFQDGDSHLRLPCGARYSRWWMCHFLPENLVKDMFYFTEELNRCDLTRQEIHILCAILLINPDRKSLINPRQVHKLHDWYLDLLAYQMQRSHAHNHGRLLINIFRMLPMLATMNMQQSEVIGNFRIDHPPDGCLRSVDAADSMQDMGTNTLTGTSFDDVSSTTEDNASHEQL